MANLSSLSCKLAKFDVGLQVFPKGALSFDIQLLESAECSALWSLLPHHQFILEAALICHVNHLFSIQPLLQTPKWSSDTPKNHLWTRCWMVTQQITHHSTQVWWYIWKFCLPPSFCIGLLDWSSTAAKSFPLIVSDIFHLSTKTAYMFAMPFLHLRGNFWIFFKSMIFLLWIQWDSFFHFFINLKSCFSFCQFLLNS